MVNGLLMAVVLGGLVLWAIGVTMSFAADYWDVGLRGVAFFPLAAVCNGIGIRQGFRDRRRVSLLWSLAALLLFLAPWTYAYFALPHS